MDKEDFEKKLSKVAEWEYRDVRAADPYSGSKAIGPTPQELLIKKIKTNPCPETGLDQHCHWHLKTYTYAKEKLRINRCATCGLTITPAGNKVIIPIVDMNLALKTKLHDKEVADNKYQDGQNILRR